MPPEVDFRALRFDHAHHADQDAAEPARHPVVVVGAGPVGLTLAIDLAQRGTPADPQALAGHDALVARENAGTVRQPFDLWTLRHTRDGSVARVRIQGALASNSGEMVRDWCLDGRGIMLRSLWDIAPQLASGELVRVLPHYAMPDADIHWVAPWRPKTPRRARLLIDFLLDAFRSEPWKAEPVTKPRPRRP